MFFLVISRKFLFICNTEPIPDEDIEGYTDSDLTIGAQIATVVEPRLIF